MLMPIAISACHAAIFSYFRRHHCRFSFAIAAISLMIAAAVRHAATIFAADFWLSPFSEFAAFDDFACPADHDF
jgi:hypothetical protein